MRFMWNLSTPDGEASTGNWACHPGDRCWNYCPDAISSSEVTATYLKIGKSPISIHYGYPISKLLQRFDCHYSDVIMGAMASQITGVSMVYSTVCSGEYQRKHRVTGLYEGNYSVTGELPSQRASNAENVSIWWRHHGIAGYQASGPSNGRTAFPIITAFLFKTNCPAIHDLDHPRQLKLRLKWMGLRQIKLFWCWNSPGKWYQWHGCWWPGRPCVTKTVMLWMS